MEWAETHPWIAGCYFGFLMVISMAVFVTAQGGSGSAAARYGVTHNVLATWARAA